MLAVETELLPDLRALLRAQLRRIQLEAEGSGGGDKAARLHRRDAPGLMIRAGGDVRADGAGGVAEGGPVLDQQAVGGVGVVAAPDLRAVIEHARVKAAASPAAALDQQLGIARAQPLEDLVDAEHIIIEHPALVARRVGKDVGDRAVGVPFEVVDLSLVEHAADAVEDRIAHLAAREVQHELAARADGRLPGDGKRPVRVAAVELAVLADHLRLHPDAEFQPERVDLRDQLAERAAELFLVHRPVAEGAQIVPALAEPAVVHHQHLDAEIGRLAGQRQQGLAAEVEIGGLPTVEQDRAVRVAVLSAADMAADAAVQPPAQCAEAFRAIAQDDLRAGQALAGLQRIGKLLLSETHLQAGLAELIPPGLGAEAAAPQQLHRPAASGGLGSIEIGEDNEGIVLMGGIAAAAADDGLAGGNRRALRLTLHGPAAAKADQIEVAADKVQTGAQQLFDADGISARVRNDGAAGDHVQRREHAVQELDAQAGTLIFQDDAQALRFLLSGVDRRETGQAVLTRQDLVRAVFQRAA